MKGTWQPSCVAENKMPTCICDYCVRNSETRSRLWGRVPAVDVVRLEKNEGLSFQRPIRVLFPRDLRDTIFSITSLPPSYKGPFIAVLNDADKSVVARNLIFLLMMFVEENPAVAAENVLHLWYSALITESCYDMFRSRLKPLVEEVCDKIARKPGYTKLRKAWKFGESSVQVVMTRNGWFSLLSYFDVPQGLTKDVAQQARQIVMSAPERIGYVDSVMCTKSPTGKLAMRKFRDNGLLLPFGQLGEEFTIPNPTLFDSRHGWPLHDTADPADGWPTKSFLEFPTGPAKNDVYGKLHYYLKHLFKKFHGRIRSLPIELNLSCFDLEYLPLCLTEKYFDRIQVSDVCDQGQDGVDLTLRTFGPLLQPVSVNPHATLITLFQDAIASMTISLGVGPHFAEDPFTAFPREITGLIMMQMPEIKRELESVNHWRTGVIKIIHGQRLMYEVEGIFKSHMLWCRFEHLAANARLEMKTTNTIISPWPMRFGIREHGSRDFALLFSSNHTGQERYVEWKVATDKDAKDVDERMKSAGISTEPKPSSFCNTP
ncbi:hypothetical protein ANO14919_088040 [Xylariales sp. No.14919]|nr:hypothetical protein ANO14919_088040 [Xylariales sp. No.14919]